MCYNSYMNKRSMIILLTGLMLITVGGWFIPGIRDKKEENVPKEEVQTGKTEEKKDI